MAGEVVNEPIAFVTMRHRCPHCRRSYAHKATAVRHMSLCFADPARRTCKTCKHDVPAEGGHDLHVNDYEPRHCAEGMEQGPSCVECGEHPDAPSACWHGQYRPTTTLRVLCPLWEAKS
jgi:hypothetical protein